MTELKMTELKKTELKKLYRKTNAWRCLVGLGLLLAVGVFAQTPQPSAPPAKPEHNQNAGEDAPSATSDANAGDDVQANKKISPQEAQELFGQVDQILKFASKDSGLSIKHEVKRRLTNREEVVAYLEKLSLIHI